jgi:hypothetical protein
MKLFELAYACPLYAAFTDFDKSINRFRAETRPALDLGQPTHRKALLVWLNSWGCMHLATRYHSMASNALKKWGLRYLDRLPHDGLELVELPNHALDGAAEAYGDLKGRRASMRVGPSGPIPVAFGPTAAAKVLHALRPNAFPPWDDPIRTHLGYDGSRNSYGQFLSSVQKNIRRLEEEAAQLGVSATEIPALVRRENSSLTKLIDEFYWVTITKGCRPPTEEELGRWLHWARTLKG